MMKRLICICICCGAAIVSGWGQTGEENGKYSVTGKVFIENHTPVELANIAVLNVQDSVFITGTCSRSDGSFEVDGLKPGTYLLQVSYLGYRTINKQCTTGESVEFTLQTETVCLDEAVVTAVRPVYKFSRGALTTTVRHSLLASVGTGRDVLKHVPGIRYSEDGYTVFGKGTPAIYIDNHLIQDYSELERLSSEDIDKVELITNPGAEYEASIKSVIRIRTTRYVRKGFGVDVKTSVSQGRRTSYSEQVNLNYQQQKLSLFTMLYFNGQSEVRRQDVQYDISGTSDWLIHSRSRFSTNVKFIGGKMGMSYDWKPEHSLGFALEINSVPSMRLDCISTYTVEDNGRHVDRVDYDSQTKQNGTTYQLNGFYQRKVGQLKINLTTDIVYGKDYDAQENEESGQVSVYRKIVSNNCAINHLYAAKMSLTYPLGAGEIKGGADCTYIRRKDDFFSSQGVLPEVDSKIKESKAAGFAEYAVVIGKVNPVIGIRYEHAVSDYWRKGVYIPEQSRVYNSWCPNLSVDFPIGKIQTSVNYMVKTNRPSFFVLRSSMSYNNRFIYEGGNPLLLPETIHDASVTFLYNWVQFIANYQYTKNAIQFQAKSYDKDPDVAIFTFDNFKNFQCLNLSLFIAPSLKVWKPEIGIFFTQPFFEVTNKGQTKKMNTPNAYFSWNNTFQLPAKWILSLDMNYQTRGNYGAMYQRQNGSVDVGIRKSFFHDSLDCNLQLSDVLATRRNSLLLYGSKMTYSKEAIPDARKISLTIRYKLNAGRAVYKGKHVSDKDIQRL